MGYKLWPRASTIWNFGVGGLMTLSMTLGPCLADAQNAGTKAEIEGLVPGTQLPENALIIHYHRSDGDYTDVTLWTWDGRNQRTPDDGELSPVGQDSFGKIFVLDLDQYGNDNSSAEQIGIIPRLRRSWDHKDGSDRYWTPALGHRIWLVGLDDIIYSSEPDISPRFKNAFIDGSKLIMAAPSHPIDPSIITPSKFRVNLPDGKSAVVEQVRATATNAVGKAIQVAVVLRSPMDWRAGPITVEAEGYRASLAKPRLVLDDLPIPGEPLGANWSPEKTIFRIWAPIAEELSVIVYSDQPGTMVEHTLEARRDNTNGVWSVAFEGNLEGKFYRLRVRNPNREPIEINDPYATNTTGPHGAARITNLRGLDPPGFRPIKRVPYGTSPVDAVIVELHVRDFSISPDSGISEENKGRYLAFTERGTHIPGKPDIKTGIEHLKEMGYTHVHLMPIQDFDNETEGPDDAYNWGYMTAFFNSPDGWFASDFRNESRIREFKQTVHSLKEAGMGVILDVVYNHTGVQNTMEQLVPGYYLRRRPDGSFFNGSGTGNEFRSEGTMGRRFIIDSCKFWLEEYGIDGFRFDLMGLIDIETMNQLKAELEALYPNVLIYGEPWAATGPDGTGIARITYKDVVKGTGIGAFNDHFRDALKGSPDGDDAGYVVNGVRRDGVKVGIAGSIDDWAANPIESINYGDKHDNLILYDKLLKTGGPGTDDAAIAKMTKLTGGILAFSQGIPFYHAGVEMLRTKGGDSNSYNAPDSVNQIEWSRKAEFAETVDFYKGVIALRKAHPVFRLRTASEVRQRLRFLEDVKLPAPETIVYSLDGKGLEGESWSRATVMINPTLNELEFPDPGPGIWKVYVMGPRASLEPFAEVSGGARIKVPGRSMALIAQE